VFIAWVQLKADGAVTLAELKGEVHVQWDIHMRVDGIYMPIPISRGMAMGMATMAMAMAHFGPCHGISCTSCTAAHIIHQLNAGTQTFTELCLPRVSPNWQWSSQ